MSSSSFRHSFNILSRDEARLSSHLPEDIISEFKTACEHEQRLPFKVEALEELHLRLLSNAVIAANLISSVTAVEWIKRLDAMLEGRKEELPPIFTHSNGLTHMRFERCMLIMLPSEQHCEDSESLVNTLNALMTDNHGISHWILDMGACTTLKPSLVAYLLGFQHSLGARAAMMLLWLRVEAVPSSLLASVKKNFRMESKGAFLLSRG